MDNKLVRIGVFYDGNYFFRASSYYAYGHGRKTRISISGLHSFIRHHIAAETKTDTRLCQIVDSHYFRGRLNAYEASQRNSLYWDRVFDDILMSEGVTTHYWHVKHEDGQKYEKAVDVSFALEAYEMTLYKKFDIVVLIASDGDFVPLIRKLNNLGTKVMLLYWDFEYIDENNKRYATRTSQDLLEEVTYPVAMHEIIDNRLRKHDPIINSLFVQSEARRPTPINPPNINKPYYNNTNYAGSTFVRNTEENTPLYNNINNTTEEHFSEENIEFEKSLKEKNTYPTNEETNFNTTTEYPQNYPNNSTAPYSNIHMHNYEVSMEGPLPIEGEVYHGEILSMKDGFGFIRFKPNNLFFHYSDVIDVDFSELNIGDIVEFVIGYKTDGRGFATQVRPITNR